MKGNQKDTCMNGVVSHVCSGSGHMSVDTQYNHTELNIHKTSRLCCYQHLGLDIVL